VELVVGAWESGALTVGHLAGFELGFVGLGNMGRPICRNLAKAGAEIAAYDLDPARRVSLIEEGVTAASSLGQVVAPGGLVVSMVPDDEALTDIALGDGGVLAGLGNGVHLSLSTVSPATSELLEKNYRKRGASFVSATVLGRPDVAERAELTVLVAGETEAKQRVLPFLDVISRAVHDFGSSSSSANIVKLGATFLIMSAIEAMAEAAALMDRHGVDRRTFLEMIGDTPLFAGLVYSGYGRMIGSHRYDPALFAVDLGLKDAELVVELAGTSTAVPIARLVIDHLRAAIEAGWSNEDWSVIGRVLAAEPVASC
jgi:3-hydroxyisobutyrate dehydrogenase-like beta-hydroxyacid dehydrogenase